MKIKTFFGIAMCLSDDNKSVECLLQKGTGNTIETSKLKTQYFPYSEMKNVITNSICKEIGTNYNLIMPQQFFKVDIIESDNKVSYNFYKQDETPELVSLFEKPDYFAGLDLTDFFNSDND